MRSVIVIGAGAAGMMAAVTAAKTGASVTVLEQNEKAGKKLFITGKGRCNLTNDSDRDTHLSQVVSNRKFLYSAETLLDAKGTMAFFESLGLRIKTERGSRVFPISDHSSDVIRVLEYEMRRLGVKLCMHTKVSGLILESGQCKGVRLSDGTLQKADAVILATGGVSYPSTGADGSGFVMAEEAGHITTALYPALTGLFTKEDVSELSGLTLKNIGILCKQGKKKLYSDFGELLFTHRGVSGPVILSASSFLTQMFHGGGRAKKGETASDPVRLIIDLKPALTAAMLDARLLREIDSSGTKQLSNMMRTLLPGSMIPYVLEQAHLGTGLRACDLGKKQRTALCEALKGFTLTLTGTEGFESAIITKGGIRVKEIDPSTMESKLVNGLYFAGECMDVDALTGGFNLQIAWSTGYLAGLSAGSDTSEMP